jgi:hypothetical protein
MKTRKIIEELSSAMFNEKRDMFPAPLDMWH